MTIERRLKPGADIVAFTPLKLDSVNANWFDYEQLDYLFFEHKQKIYFVFEKVLNNKRAIYYKVIDTSGKSTGFIELLNLERENNVIDFNFSFKRTNESKVLVTTSKTGMNGVRRKVLILIDLFSRKVVWTKKLPLERANSDDSSEFTCNNSDDLFYFFSKYNVQENYTYFPDYGTLNGAIKSIDSLFLMRWEASATSPQRVGIDTREVTNIKNISLVPFGSQALVSLKAYTEDSLNHIKEFILNYCFNSSMEMCYKKTVPLDSAVQKQLTFFDGPYKESYYKTHNVFANYISSEYLFSLAERQEGYYNKEIVFDKMDLRTGEVLTQKIIPRKIYFFKNRSRFKNVAKVMVAKLNDTIFALVLEAPSNFKKDPNNFNYRDFKKETNLWNSNLVLYSISNDNELRKKLVYNNSDFDMIPLNYSSENQNEMVLYLNSNKYEKFAILKLNPF